MDNFDELAKRRNRLTVNSEGREGQLTPAHLELISQQHTFLSEVELAGMNIGVRKSWLLSSLQPLEDTAALLRNAVDHVNASSQTLLHTTVICERLRDTFTARKELATAEEGSPEAILKKKRTQLRILDDEFLANHEKVILIAALDVYTPQLEGLDANDQDELAAFREAERLAELSKARASVVSLSAARKNRKKKN